MTWRGPRKPRDPIYTSAAHRAARQYWIRRQTPCAICGGQILYSANGSYDPRAFHLDHHPVSIAQGRTMGWTDEQISALTNTRPTHRHCNTKHGQRLGQRRQHAKQKHKKIRVGQLDDSRRW